VGTIQYYIVGHQSSATLLQRLTKEHGSKTSPLCQSVTIIQEPADSAAPKERRSRLTAPPTGMGNNAKNRVDPPDPPQLSTQEKWWYIFSIMRSATNSQHLPENTQICFFESHFTELKSGWISGESGTSDPLLRWDISGTTYWNVTWDAGLGTMLHTRLCVLSQPIMFLSDDENRTSAQGP